MLIPFEVKLYFDRTKEASNITQYSMEDLVLLTQEEDLSRPSAVHLLGLVEQSAPRTPFIGYRINMNSFI